MGLLGLLKNLVLLAKNAPKIPGIIATLASPNFIENISSIMVQNELGPALDEREKALEEFPGGVPEDVMRKDEIIEQATKAKMEQLDPPISAALAPVTAAFGVPIFLTKLIDFLSAGGASSDGFNVSLDSNPNDAAMEADVGVALTPPDIPPVKTLLTDTGTGGSIITPKFDI